MPETFSFDFDPVDFSLDLCVNCGQVFRWRRVATDESGPTRWVGVDGEFWYDVKLTEPGQFLIETNGSRKQFVDLFRFGWDGGAARHQILVQGPEIEPYIDQLPGLRLMQPSSTVETFFCFLCTPNNHLSRISAMIETLGRFGEPMPNGTDLNFFPSLEAIASIPEDELRARGFGYRGATIPKAARALLDLGGEHYIAQLKTCAYLEAHTALMGIPGVGPKLADCIALYGLNHTEAVPIDTHIWQAAVRLYFPEWRDAALTPQRYRETSEFLRNRFGKLAGWAHQYLFFDNVLNWRDRKKKERS